MNVRKGTGPAFQIGAELALQLIDADPSALRIYLLACWWFTIRGSHPPVPVVLQWVQSDADRDGLSQLLRDRWLVRQDDRLVVQEEVFGQRMVWLKKKKSPDRNRKPIGASVRFRVLQKHGFRCAYCGASGEVTTLHIDHVVPVASGGGNEEHNLVAACTDCNLGKGDRPVGLAQ
jgi:uncharacterized protein with PIN domain